jgi:hypothetical protein
MKTTSLAFIARTGDMRTGKGQARHLPHKYLKKSSKFKVEIMRRRRRKKELYQTTPKLKLISKTLSSILDTKAFSSFPNIHK